MIREQEVTQVNAAPHRSKIFNTKWVYLAFFILLGTLLFFIFSNQGITGNIIKEKIKNETRDLPIEANLEGISGFVELKQPISRMYIELEGNGNVFIGKESIIEISKNTPTRLLLEGFDGLVSFDGENIYMLKGKTTKLKVNGLPTSSTGGKVEIRIDKEIAYNSIELDKVILEEYGSTESGKVDLNNGDILINLDKDKLHLKGFEGYLKNTRVGTLGTRGTGLKLKGTVEDIEVGGSFNMKFS